MQKAGAPAAAALPGAGPAAGAAPPPRPGLVAFTGTGPGDTGLLTLRAAELLGQAGLVVGSAELIRRVAHLVPGAATVIEAGQDGARAGALIRAAPAGPGGGRPLPGRSPPLRRAPPAPGPLARG